MFEFTPTSSRNCCFSGRAGLLSGIEGFKKGKLKKAVTVDKSGPAIEKPGYALYCIVATFFLYFSLTSHFSPVHLVQRILGRILLLWWRRRRWWRRWVVPQWSTVTAEQKQSRALSSWTSSRQIPYGVRIDS